MKKLIFTMIFASGLYNAGSATDAMFPLGFSQDVDFHHSFLAYIALTNEVERSLESIRSNPEDSNLIENTVSIIKWLYADNEASNEKALRDMSTFIHAELFNNKEEEQKAELFLNAVYSKLNNNSESNYGDIYSEIEG